MKRDQQSECGGCGSSERWLLHTVRHRGAYRRLCTNCTLRNQQGLFCPICLEVYQESPPPEERVMCLKCPSISHLSCVPNDSSSPSFLCAPCSSPNFTFFNVNRKRPKGPDAEADNHIHRTLLDKDSAKALVAAAKIAAASMSKAAAVARVEAERRVKEAALAKKRAREALERLSVLVAKDKVKDTVSPKPVLKGSVPPADQKVKSRPEAISGDKRIHNQAGALGPPRARNGTSAEGNDKQSRSGQGEKGSNGLYSVSHVNTGQLQRQHSGRGVEN